MNEKNKTLCIGDMVVFMYYLNFECLILIGPLNQHSHIHGFKYIKFCGSTLGKGL